MAGSRRRGWRAGLTGALAGSLAVLLGACGVVDTKDDRRAAEELAEKHFPGQLRAIGARTLFPGSGGSEVTFAVTDDRDASFDLVVTREVLHLLPRPERPVSEIFRVLRPGGQFIVGQIVPYADVDAFWMFRVFKKKQPLLYQMFREEDFRALLTGGGFTDVRMEEHFLWESIDRWIDTHETTPANRQEIYRLYYEAPREVRAVHPFEVLPDGSVRDRWRWCVYSVRKPDRG